MTNILKTRLLKSIPRPDMICVGLPNRFHRG